MRSTLDVGMRVAREISSTLMRFASRCRRRYVPTLSIVKVGARLLEFLQHGAAFFRNRRSPIEVQTTSQVSSGFVAPTQFHEDARACPVRVLECLAAWLLGVERPSQRLECGRELALPFVREPEPEVADAEQRLSRDAAPE